MQTIIINSFTVVLPQTGGDEFGLAIVASQTMDLPHIMLVACADKLGATTLRCCKSQTAKVVCRGITMVWRAARGCCTSRQHTAAAPTPMRAQTNRYRNELGTPPRTPQPAAHRHSLPDI
jgi:hypothetical protein